VAWATGWAVPEIACCRAQAAAAWSCSNRSTSGHQSSITERRGSSAMNTTASLAAGWPASKVSSISMPLWGLRERTRPSASSAPRMPTAS
jgi:hypothetical protein